MTSDLLGLEESQIHRSISSVRNTVMSDFVPNHLEFAHISHEEFCKSYTTETAIKLFETIPDNAITVQHFKYFYFRKVWITTSKEDL